jgi:hypothetical protein
MTKKPTMRFVFRDITFYDLFSLRQLDLFRKRITVRPTIFRNQELFAGRINDTVCVNRHTQHLLKKVILFLSPIFYNVSFILHSQSDGQIPLTSNVRE